MTLTAWTQNADLSTEDLGELSFDEAIALIDDFAWQQQRHYFDRLTQRKDEACQAGVGLWMGDNLFHLMIEPGRNFALHVELAQNGKILGLFPRPRREWDVLVDDLSQAKRLLDVFTQGDHEQLETQLRQHQESEATGLVGQ